MLPHAAKLSERRRLLRFDPMTHSIDVLTYSPWFDRWGYSKATDEENRFSLLNAW